MNSVGYSFSSITYKPQNPPGPENFEEHQCYLKGEELVRKAGQVSDFFTRSDNSAVDLDPRPGYVRLNRAFAPELMERNSQVVSGFQTPDGGLQAYEPKMAGGDPSTLSIANGGQDITMERPVYVNDRYAPTLESVILHADGSRTASWQYRPGHF
ncbi:MAG: hypothetical protein KF760_26520 [Candidatus Eremiobacteraeota bacterium]|nr:hypothetical protein [Candidatus Eremiobacteraeota bacterium]MCW5870544.1 hypothetical protein [Candidatus Eremiobacteraeota bacterium]